jgi:hypothetical protein
MTARRDNKGRFVAGTKPGPGRAPKPTSADVKQLMILARYHPGELEQLAFDLAQMEAERKMIIDAEYIDAEIKERVNEAATTKRQALATLQRLVADLTRSVDRE